MDNFSNALATLNKYGYGHFKSVLKKEVVDSFRNNFFFLFNTLSGYYNEKEFDSEIFSEKLKLFRDSDPKKFNALFKTSKLTNAFNNLFYNQQIQSLCSNILGINAETVVIGEKQLRIDEPKDKLYTLDWHQDSPYYPQAKGGKDSIVINICLQHCTKNMGSVELIKGSHKNGTLEVINDNIVSNVEQLKVNKEIIDKNNIIVLEPEVSDVIIYDMNLIHRSGYNDSNKARVSVIGRAFNPLSDNFTPYQYTNLELVNL